MAKSANDRHWHVAVPIFTGALALALMPIFMSRVAWAAFACLTIAAFGIWSPHGPLMSWPAVILSGTNAASGEHHWQRALAPVMGSTMLPENRCPWHLGPPWAPPVLACSHPFLHRCCIW